MAGTVPKRKAPLSAKEVAALGVGNHRVGGVAGLTLQVNKTGQGRSYTLRYTDAAGKRREVGIGSAWEITVQQARDKCLELRQRLRLDNIDPIAARAAAKAAAVEHAFAQTTFSQAVGEYLRSRQGGWGNPKHEAQWISTLAAVEPVLGTLAVQDIAPDHVAQALLPIWTTKHETATRTRQRVEAVIAHADVRAKRLRPNPAALKGRLEHLLPKVTRVVVGHAALPWREAPAFMKRLRQVGGVGARALEFAILTAARSGEVRGAVWGEIVGDVWTIPGARMKAGRPHTVPLSKAALACLGERGQDGALLFPGMKGELSDMALLAVLKRLEVATTVHGFRSTFRSWCGDSGHDRELAELALAHSIGNAVEQAYNRTDLLARRRQLMADWAAYIGL
jgi:integrase